MHLELGMTDPRIFFVFRTIQNFERTINFSFLIWNFDPLRPAHSHDPEQNEAPLLRITKELFTTFTQLDRNSKAMGKQDKMSELSIYQAKKNSIK